ncbi:MAG: hypothetical protein GY805_15065, partial [Chloroflexi bacterium]|nr:hypothetical protein [Chloroflexota bacterium]
EGLGHQVQARMMADASGDPDMDQMPPPPSPPSQTQFAVGVAKNLLEEAMAPEQRDTLIRTGLMFLGVVLLINLVSNWLTNKIAQKVVNKLKD